MIEDKYLNEFVNLRKNANMAFRKTILLYHFGTIFMALLVIMLVKYFFFSITGYDIFTYVIAFLAACYPICCKWFYSLTDVYVLSVLKKENVISEEVFNDCIDEYCSPNK